jgi:hypothetical protein
MPLEVRELGRIGYRDALSLQDELVAARRRGEGADTLLLLEHPPVVTLGRSAHGEHLLVPEEVLAARGVDAYVELHEVTSHTEAVELAFPGSPTIRIDGCDVDPVGAASRAALTCRIYKLPDGRVSPVPSREQLEEALQ